MKVGRYSERDTAPTDPSALPVGFKSKVVSRRHCELWCASGQWYIKDVKSSSGTFLNHVRLSSPGVESRPYPVNDGDVVQLGIDFKGGEEVIFRCVKIRVECNRGWQKSLNNFNTSTHKRLLKSATTKKNRDSDAASVNSSECSICLNPVAPCQALFVAPCSHVWHYKCVRNLIDSPSWPNFLCPNCRFVADLEADVEQPGETLEEEWEEAAFDEDAGSEKEQGESTRDTTEGAAGDGDTSNDAENCDHERTRAQGQGQASASITDDELAGLLTHTSLNNQAPSARHTTCSTPSDSSQQPTLTTPSIPISQRPAYRTTNTSDTATTPTSNSQFALASGSYPVADGPMTPRNDAGPFVLDGSAGRGEDRLDGIVRETVMEEGEISEGSEGSEGSRGSGGTAEGSGGGGSRV